MSKNLQSIAWYEDYVGSKIEYENL